MNDADDETDKNLHSLHVICHFSFLINPLITKQWNNAYKLLNIRTTNNQHEAISTKPVKIICL